MMIKNYITGLCFYYTILFIILLECTLPLTKKEQKKFAVNTVYRVMPAAASYILCLPHFLIASFSLVLDLITFCTET